MENARNYSEPELDIGHSWEEDSLSYLEETLTHFINMTQLNFEKLNRYQETVLNNMETSFEKLEMQLGEISSQLASNGDLY